MPKEVYVEPDPSKWKEDGSEEYPYDSFEEWKEEEDHSSGDYEEYAREAPYAYEDMWSAEDSTYSGDLDRGTVSDVDYSVYNEPKPKPKPDTPYGSYEIPDYINEYIKLYEDKIEGLRDPERLRAYTIGGGWDSVSEGRDSGRRDRRGRDGGRRDRRIQEGTGSAYHFDPTLLDDMKGIQHREIDIGKMPQFRGSEEVADIRSRDLEGGRIEQRSYDTKLPEYDLMRQRIKGTTARSVGDIRDVAGSSATALGAITDVYGQEQSMMRDLEIESAKYTGAMKAANVDLAMKTDIYNTEAKMQAEKFNIQKDIQEQMYETDSRIAAERFDLTRQQELDIYGKNLEMKSKQFNITAAREADMYNKELEKQINMYNNQALNQAQLWNLETEKQVDIYNSQMMADTDRWNIINQMKIDAMNKDIEIMNREQQAQSYLTGAMYEDKAYEYNVVIPQEMQFMQQLADRKMDAQKEIANLQMGAQIDLAEAQNKGQTGQYIATGAATGAGIGTMIAPGIGTIIGGIGGGLLGALGSLF